MTYTRSQPSPASSSTLSTLVLLCTFAFLFHASLTPSTAITVEWAHKEPPLVQLFNVSQVHTFVSEGNWTFLGFFHTFNESGFLDFYRMSNSDLHGSEISFAVVNDTAVGSEYGIDENTWPTVVLMQGGTNPKTGQEFEERRIALHPRKQPVTWDSISVMYQANIFPLPVVGELSAENINAYHRRGLPIVFCFLNYEDKMLESYIELLAQLGERFAGALSIGFLNGLKMDREMLAYGLPFRPDGKNLPMCSIATFKPKRRNYVFNSHKNKFNFQNLATHFEMFLNNKLKATVRSAMAPSEQSGPVRRLVLSGWEETVISNSKKRDVFVMFFAPWCEHCKKLEPYWKAFGEMVEPIKSKLLVADIDGTKNDVLDLPGNPSSYPRLYYFPWKNKTEPIMYVAPPASENDPHGGRSVQSFVDFIFKTSKLLEDEDRALIEGTLENKIFEQEQYEFEQMLRANETNTEEFIQQTMEQFRIEQKARNEDAKVENKIIEEKLAEEAAKKAQEAAEGGASTEAEAPPAKKHDEL